MIFILVLFGLIISQSIVMYVLYKMILGRVTERKLLDVESKNGMFLIDRINNIEVKIEKIITDIEKRAVKKRIARGRPRKSDKTRSI